MSQPDLEALSDVVIQTVQDAIAPLVTRLAVAEATVALLAESQKSVTELRERLVVAETKAAALVPPPAVDVAPVLEKVGELRDRLVAIETKSAGTHPDTSLGRLDALEARVTAMGERVSATEHRVELKAAETAPLLTALADLTKDIGAMRERVAVVEVRQPVPGPAGKDGTPGKDGADGLGFDDMAVDFDGERTFTLKYARGERVKTAGVFTVAVPIYRGIFTEGKTYQAGDVVTFGGNAWFCRKETTVKPDYVGQGPQPKDFWTLMVKQGRDGKDGRDAVTTPVVRVGASA